MDIKKYIFQDLNYLYILKSKLVMPFHENIVRKLSSSYTISMHINVHTLI